MSSSSSSSSSDAVCPSRPRQKAKEINADYLASIYERKHEQQMIERMKCMDEFLKTYAVPEAKNGRKFVEIEWNVILQHFHKEEDSGPADFTPEDAIELFERRGIDAEHNSDLLFKLTWW